LTEGVALVDGARVPVVAVEVVVASGERRKAVAEKALAGFAVETVLSFGERRIRAHDGVVFEHIAKIVRATAPIVALVA